MKEAAIAAIIKGVLRETAQAELAPKRAVAGKQARFERRLAERRAKGATSRQRRQGSHWRWVLDDIYNTPRVNNADQISTAEPPVNNGHAEFVPYGSPVPWRGRT